MVNYQATITWQRMPNEVFIDRRYSRAHQWVFDGGATVAASASPHIVPLPYSRAENVDPEEAFIATLSSCHMLFFLSIAAEQGWCVDRYEDKASGTLAQNAEGKMAMTEVILQPEVVFSGERCPSPQDEKHLHHLAHEKCFIANSVKTKVVVSARPPLRL